VTIQRVVKAWRQSLLGNRTNLAKACAKGIAANRTAANAFAATCCQSCGRCRLRGVTGLCGLASGSAE
jgi:hypothetical protein